MKFNKINMEQWDRREHFEHYFKHVKCGFSITENIDITKLLTISKAKEFAFYPIVLYMASVGVNAQMELRTYVNEAGEVGYWEQVHPSYTIFHKNTHTFSELWTEYSKEFKVFYQNYKADMHLYGNDHSFFPKKDCPLNNFPVSCIPWSSFSGFNLNLFGDSQFLSPIITFGKYFEEGDTVQLPVSVQIHHAAADGYHVSQFLVELQKLVLTAEEWLL